MLGDQRNKMISAQCSQFTDQDAAVFRFRQAWSLRLVGRPSDCMPGCVQSGQSQHPPCQRSDKFVMLGGTSTGTVAKCLQSLEFFDDYILNAPPNLSFGADPDYMDISLSLELGHPLTLTTAQQIF